MSRQFIFNYPQYVMRNYLNFILFFKYCLFFGKQKKKDVWPHGNDNDNDHKVYPKK